MTEDEYERVFWEAERQFREIICGDRLMWLNNQGIARIRQALPGGSVLDEKRARGAPRGAPERRRRIPAEHEHIKNLTPHPALTGEGGKVLVTRAAC